ncbi:DNA primase [Peptoniphilus equinus]|uniref:DNA primase n=1 Tax=Peptoniphilus equinus TaxID=3016343 RepID=A0ABY7QVK9_9FIRM|nr:DNA primase [Peptoniphilus equinus]WBW50386.1 DNA primase [Peptoniphilus equinus]
MSFIIDDSVLDEIRERTDIVQVIGDYVQLKKSGSNYMGLCPFHNEKTPSFSVSPNKGIFKCFGCGEGGDVISFIMKREHLEFRDAVKFLADKYGIELQTYHSHDDSLKQDRERAYKAYRQAAIFYMQNLTHSRVPLDYLIRRGIDKKTILQFGLGYALDSWDSLYNHLKGEYTDDELLRYNLVSKSKRGTCIDRFRNRVMFPIIDTRGRVIAFGGRTLGQDHAKYLNSSDTPIFNKGEHLYNLHHLKDDAGDKAVLVEGYMDVISLSKSGINYCVASLGTSLTEAQAKLLKRYNKSVYICYDSDSAGIRATQRAIDILIAQGIRPKVIELPEGLDPDDFVKAYGKLSFELEMTKAKTYMDYKIETIKAKFNLDAADGLAGFTTEVSALISRLKNPIERDVYATKVAQTYGISKASIESYMVLRAKSQLASTKRKADKEFGRRETTMVEKATQSATSSSSRSQVERLLLAYAMTRRSRFLYVLEVFPTYELTTLTVRDAFETLRDKVDAFDGDVFSEAFKEAYLEPLALDVEDSALDFDRADVIIDELLIKLKQYKLEEKRDTLLQQITSLDGQEGTEGHLSTLLQELQAVNRELSSQAGGYYATTE